jgi:hypothetical protein
MRRLLSALALSLSLIAAHPASAQGYGQSNNAEADSPLVIIRYNQPRIYYDRQLYNAVQRAINIKPSVQFSVVSFVPQIGSEDQRERIRSKAASQTRKFLYDLKQMGIPRDRINITREVVRDARYHEIYLYVD